MLFFGIILGAGITSAFWRPDRTQPEVRLLSSRVSSVPAETPGAAAPAPAPAPFRVLTYNMRHGARDDGTVDLEAVARVLRESSADVIALQEVDTRQFRSGMTNQGEWLARELGMELVFAPTMRRGLGRYGNALLSRYPVRERAVFPLPAELEPRGAVVARLEVPGGDVTVAVSHFGLSAADRRAQAEALARALAGTPEPVVLLGDWNADADAPELEPLRGRFSPVRPDGAPATLRRRDGTGVAAIDHVWISGGVAALEAHVSEERVSDHRPVTALLVLPRRG